MEHVHLKVSDLERSLDFYCGLLGFSITSTYGTQAVFISAGGYHHHIGLNTWHSLHAPPAKAEGVGLYYTAVLYRDRKELAFIFNRLSMEKYPISGVSDHGVSDAIYLNDPDENGVELYWDRPAELWNYKADGSIDMFTKALDIQSLLNELK
jgi:catechol 2,3-dioxygenase